MTNWTNEELEVQLDHALAASNKSDRQREAAEAENLRVRGLLQRQWISVEERLPKVGEMVLLFNNEGHIDTGWRCFDGRTEIFQLERTAPQDEPIVYELVDGRVTHWMPLPDPPTIPQSSSQGAESADIGKLDTADKSGDGK